MLDLESLRLANDRAAERELAHAELPFLRGRVAALTTLLNGVLGILDEPLSRKWIEAALDAARAELRAAMQR